MVSSTGRLSFVGLVMVSFVLHAGTANAQMCASDDIRCQNVPVTWRGEARLFDDIGFDTTILNDEGHAVPRNFAQTAWAFLRGRTLGMP